MNKFTLMGLLCALSMLSFTSQAETMAWKIVPDKSMISFTAVQNNAPVKGQFKQFSGNIHFDPNALKDSKVDLNIDMNSVNTSYGAIADTLKTAEWFNVKLFPKAEFTTDHFNKLGDKIYQADGKLTIRNKTIPASIKFTLDEFDKDKAQVKGTTTIKRTTFGIGQGEWADTDEVKDNVEIDFNFVLNPNM